MKRADTNEILKNGFKFTFNEKKCSQCKGICCTGNKRSFLFVTEKEIKLISKYLGIKIYEFRDSYLYSHNNKWTIKDCKIKGIFQCIFLDENTGKCEIYMVRPKQCRSYPFWERFKEHPEELFSECIAINK